MTDKMREEFKEWARSRGMSLPINDDIHYNEWTQIAWESWQASREALVIELPQRFYMQAGDGPGVYPQAEPDGEWLEVDTMLVVLEAAGVKVK